MQDILNAGLYSTLAVPTSSDDKPIAWFAINATADTVYTYEDGILAERIVTQSAGVVANALLRAELQQNIAQRITLAEIGCLVSSSVELDDMYKTLTGLIRGVIPFDRIVILTANLASNEVVSEYVEGIEFESSTVGSVVSITNSAIKNVISAGDEILPARGAGPQPALREAEWVRTSSSTPANARFRQAKSPRGS